MALSDQKNFSWKSPDLIILGFWLAFVLAYFLPPMIRGITVPHPQVWFFELSLQWLPFWDYASDMLKQGLLPSWAPHLYCGWPFSSHPMTNVYYPPFYLLMYLDYIQAAYLENIIGFIWSGAFVYLTFRKFGLSPLASLAGMLSFVGGNYFTVFSTYGLFIRALFLYTSATWATVSLAKDQPRFRYLALLVISLALGFTVHVEQQIYVCFFLLGLVFFASPSGDRLRRVVFLAFGLAAAGILAFWPLINLAAYLPFSLRAQGISFSHYASTSTSFSSILAFFVPAHQIFFTIALHYYLGWSVIWLVMEGIRTLKRAAIPGILALVIYGMFVSEFKPMLWVTYHLPVLGRFMLHYTSSVVIFAICAGFAAFGAESVFNRFRQSQPKLLVPALLALLMFPLFAFTRDLSRAVLLGLTGLCGLILVPRFPGMRKKQLAILWVFVFISVDLLLLNYRDRPRTPYHQFDIHPVAREFLQMPVQERFWVLTPLVDERNIGDTQLHPLMGMRLSPLLPGTHSPLGYWRMLPMRLAKLFDRICPGYVSFDDQGRLDNYKPELVYGRGAITQRTLPLLSLMNVGKIFSRGIRLDPVEGLSSEKIKNLIIYKNHRVLPRAFLVNRIVRSPDPETALNLTSSGVINFQKQVVMEGRFPFAPPGFSPAENTGRLKILHARPGYWEFKINAPAYLSDQSLPQYLLFVSESHLPGWRAELDGREIPVYYANYAFMGVPLTPGSYNLKLIHRPVEFGIGLWASISATAFWMLILGLFFLKKIGRKRNDGVES